MSTPITPTPNPPPATYPIPAPGEGVTSANTAQYVQPIVDSIAWAGSRVPGLNPSTALLSIPLSLTGAYAPSGSWSQGFSGSYTYWANSVAGLVYIPLKTMMPGVSIHSFNFLYSGATGYGGLPAVMPVVSLIKQPRGLGAPAGSLGAPTVIDSQSDPSASAAAFKNIHLISKVLGVTEFYDTSQDYYIRVASESGGGYVAGSQIWSNGYIEVSA